MIFKEIPKLLINLPERKDRLEHFREQSKYLPLENVKIIPGVKDKIPVKGIGQSHINCIKLAKENQWNEVLIMEDDVLFQAKERTEDYLNKCLENLPDQWDILLGGVYFCKGKNPYNEYWFRVGDFCSLHFYIANSRVFDRILEYNFKDHIDRWLNRENDKLCFVSQKFFAIQMDGLSDNTGKREAYGRKLDKFKLL